MNQVSSCLQFNTGKVTFQFRFVPIRPFARQNKKKLGDLRLYEIT